MARLLTPKEQTDLLALARATIIAHINHNPLPAPQRPGKGLELQNGCFVTIKQHGDLRGCIGTFTSSNPLWKTIQEMAVSAATRDPRFYPMKPTDLNDFSLEISVLSPMQQISSINEIQIGTHGLFLRKGFSQGVLLPQVATEYGWDRETFLRHTCLKAGLPENGWEKDCELFIFSALVFGEQPALD
jgi:uncharacterized protein